MFKAWNNENLVRNLFPGLARHIFRRGRANPDGHASRLVAGPAMVPGPPPSGVVAAEVALPNLIHMQPNVENWCDFACISIKNQKAAFDRQRFKMIEDCF